MVTAASTADLAIILIDARKGVLRRPAAIPTWRTCWHSAHRRGGEQDGPGRLLARHLRSHQGRLPGFCRQLGISKLRFLPMSALQGDMIVDRGERLDWYDGPTLLELLETVPAIHSAHAEKFRFPVQYVCRPQDSANPELHDYRGFMGRVESGELPSATR
jgi:sulfate adenylyltransferase subunit 1